jgi:hypothetical protein
MVNQESHALIVIGIVMVLAGPIIMFFGDRRMPVRGGVVLRMFERRPRSEDGSFPGSSYRVLFGAGVLFAGVMVLLRAFDVL